jgi:hypothetical protein
MSRPPLAVISHTDSRLHLDPAVYHPEPSAKQKRVTFEVSGTVAPVSVLTV